MLSTSQRFKQLIDWHVAEGTDGIVVVGTTGESPTVDFDEHKELIRIAVAAFARAASRSSPAPAATRPPRRSSSPNRPRRHGATACLSVVPYYNKPTQEGLYRHFRKIAETVDLPMILYNVPGRTVADLQNDTVLRLAQVPGIIGIKEATANIERGTDLIRRAPRNFAIYSGDDATALALILLGGHGVISVTANVAPKADAPDVRRRAGRRREEGARAQPAGCSRCTRSCSSRRTRSRSSGRWPRWA